MSSPCTGNICFLNSNITWGGGEKWHFEAALRIAIKTAVETWFVTNPKSQLYQRVSMSGIKVYGIGIYNLSFLNIYKIIRLVRFFREKRIEIVVLNLPADLKIAGISARIAGVRRIIYRRGSAIPIKDTILNRFLFRYVVTDVIANSTETRQTILQKNSKLFPVDKISVIYNGINVNLYDYIEKAGSSKEIVIGNVGRLEKQKGQRYLLEVAEILKSKGLKFKILIAGEGKLEHSLKRDAERRNVADVVHFVGFIDDVNAFMQEVDIFVLPSLWEGFGYVIVEAMACGKPVVAFDVSSNPELVINGKTGFLIKPYNAKAMSESIHVLMEDPVLRGQMGGASRKMVESNFTIERVQTDIESHILFGKHVEPSFV